MIISITETREFVPLWQGNREEPESSQIKVGHKSPTVAIKDKLNPRKFDFNKDGEVTGTFEVDRRKVLAALVTNISNLAYVNENGTESKVATIDQLFSAPTVFDSLIDEIYAYLQEILNAKVNEKN